MKKGVLFFLIAYLLLSPCLLHAATPPQKEGAIVITAKQFEVRGEQKTAKAVGNVQVSRGPLLLTGDSANYSERTKEIELIGEKKPVWFRYQDIQGTCGKALYLLTKKIIIMTNHPRVTRGKDQLEGERIEFHLSDQRLMIGGNSKVKLSEETLDRE